MRARWVAAAMGAGLAVRVVRSRHRRFLHPDGRSFEGELETRGAAGPTGSDFLDRPARYRVTVRVSKGAGMRGARLDLRGVAVRVHLPGRDLDLLLSTAGNGVLTRHLPVPRRSFDVTYGTITAYRTGSRTKVYLFAHPDPDGPALGRALPEVAEGDRIVLGVRHAGVARPLGRVTLGPVRSPAADAALAYDPVRNSLPDLHPTGLVHGVRAGAYRLSQRWRGATPARANPEAVARTGAHR
jgi:hypothetical protein